MKGSDHMRHQSPLFIFVLLVSLLLAACGGQQAAEPTTPAGTQPTSAAPGTGQTERPTSAGAATSQGTAAPTGAMTRDNPPPVANANTLSQYQGVTLTYYGDSVGLGAEMDDILTRQFNADTGINVNVIRKPQDVTENYATYQRFFQAQSQDIDVMMLDIIWPGAFAPHLADLGPALGTAAQQHYPGIIQNNTIDGRLVAMPWFGDFGMLFYRSDLLQKYGFSAPPKTWDELEEQARTIMDGERQAGNANFTGFVWQGAAYEGLTCTALEWIYTQGGGTIIDNTGQITLDNPQALAALNRARGWVGTISPTGVTGYREEDSRNIFQSGNAAFMRNWPYAYAAANQADSPIQGKFDVAPLPAQDGATTAGTVGGWQLGVSAYSRNPEAAIEFVRYMTSPEVQIWRAVVGSYVPTIASVSTNEQVIQAMPFLEKFTDVERITRPSARAGANYNEVSSVFFQGVNQILLGQDASQVIPQILQRMERGLPR